MEIGLPLIVALLFVVFVLLFYSNSQRKKSLRSSFLATPEAEPDYVRQGDSWEGSFADAENAKPLSVELEISYVDGAGLRSQRTIRVIEFDNDLFNGILIAHCQLRNAMRTFRFNRIEKCIDTSTGEQVRDIAAYLDETYASKVRAAGEPAA